MLVYSANKDVRAVLELDEDEVADLRREYQKISYSQTPITDSLITEILQLTEEGEGEL